VTDSDAAFDVDSAEWLPIAPQARLLWGVTASAVIVVIGVPLIVAGAIAAGIAGAAAGLALILALLALAWWLVDRRYRAWGYALREQDLLVRKGVLIRRLSIVPFGRMQFIDIAQGPLDRLWQLAGVQLHTAAAASDAKIPLLALDDARRLRDQLAALGEARASGI
jgi:uncharacterized protein